MDGLTLVYGFGEDGEATDLQTYGVQYTMGSVSAAYQKSERDNTGSTADEESTGLGVSIAVNENMSLSYNVWDVDMDTALDEESTGISASYTMGSMKFVGVSNETENVAGSAGDDTFREISVTFAF